MALPYRVAKNSALHWAGRLAVFVIVAGVFWMASSGWSNSKVGLLADGLIIAIAVTGVNLITGYTGQLSLGHSAFFAIGAYTSMLLTQGKIFDMTWSPGWTLPVAAIVCFAVGAVVGLPALRLKGIYLALTTLVFVEAVLALLRYEPWAGVTGGSRGIKGEKYSPPSWTGLDGRADVNKWFLWLSAGLLLLIAILVGGLIRSRIGRAMIATRDNQTAAAVMGVNLASIKTITFGLSGAITGIAGSLYGLKLGLVNPEVPLFGLIGAITFVVAMVVGGAAQAWGPLVGALFYTFVNDYARTIGENPSENFLFSWFVDEGTKIVGLGGIVFGLLLILFARFAPFGAVGTYKLLRSRVVVVLPSPPVVDVPILIDPEVAAAMDTATPLLDDAEADAQEVTAPEVSGVDGAEPTMVDSADSQGEGGAPPPSSQPSA